jgi:hypothetical protein
VPPDNPLHHLGITPARPIPSIWNVGHFLLFGAGLRTFIRMARENPALVGVTGMPGTPRSVTTTMFTPCSNIASAARQIAQLVAL